MDSRATLLLRLAWLACLASAVTAQGALFPKNFIDHTLCCPPRGGEVADFATAHAPALLTAAASAPAASAQASAAAAGTKAEVSAPPTATPRPEMLEGGYLKLGFDVLASYRLENPDYNKIPPGENPPSIEHLIPEAIKAFNGKKAVVTGFMLPTKYEQGFVTELLLMRDPMMCCYGLIPNPNEWIVVTSKKGFRAFQDIPLSFHGTLEVKEKFQHGALIGIYFLEAEKMTEVK